MIGYGIRYVWIPIFPKKMEEVTYYLIKPQYCYKQASISFFVNHDLQMLATLISIVIVESLGHAWDLRELKITILAFSVGTD